MNAPRLHYIYEPLCGWCYGAAPLVRAAQALITIQLHAGGMMTGARRQFIDASLRDYIRGHDAQIAKCSGQAFGKAYSLGLLENPQTVLDSTVPSAAIIAAEQLSSDPHAGLAMLNALQLAHYVDGKPLADIDTVGQLATALGIQAKHLKQRMQDLLAEEQGENACEMHFKQTHRLMRQLGVQGFPSMALQHQGVFHTLNVGAYLGKPDAFRADLKKLLADIAAP